ncbi:hypothetical protein DERP_006518 [Dermatophagoides pteronyssinus]|uniref:Uncharacterized protein n=1 Tax=Dermatophagoides pteronyssinus TaxID=6956 RepID=A0ABQ8IQU5_DERPT|nr:hypothetical protein DERP_006518 [Dermatophagoides pteronyssinus]
MDDENYYDEDDDTSKVVDCKFVWSLCPKKIIPESNKKYEFPNNKTQQKNINVGGGKTRTSALK